MKFFSRITTLLLAASSVTSATASPKKAKDLKQKQAPCKTVSKRVPWQRLTQAEKHDYINADLCLMDAPPKDGIPGAVSRWDELQYPHVVQTWSVHEVGAFLPFHRYYMSVHERLIRDECGYTGRMPYWDEPADLEDISASVLWAEDAFGGNGSGEDMCVSSGPFTNLTLRYNVDSSVTTGHCLTRNFSQEVFNGADKKYIEECNALETYEEAWECWSLQPHSAGHGGTGGIMLDSTLSPGDPVFYLHHSYLDKLWWDWQQMGKSRFWDMGGPNVPPKHNMSSVLYPGPEFTDYFGDGGGNVTTLNHTIFMAGLVANLTIGDIMDIRGPHMCTNYE